MYEILFIKNKKLSAEKILNMDQKNIKYHAEKQEVLCRKIRNILQKDIKYSAEKL